jgi:hypothetical protein
MMMPGIQLAKLPAARPNSTLNPPHNPCDGTISATKNNACSVVAAGTTWVRRVGRNGAEMFNVTSATTSPIGCRDRSGMRAAVPWTSDQPHRVA